MTEELHAKILNAVVAMEERLTHAIKEAVDGRWDSGEGGAAERCMQPCVWPGAQAPSEPSPQGDNGQMDVGERPSSQRLKKIQSHLTLDVSSAEGDTKPGPKEGGFRRRAVRLVANPMFDVLVNVIIWLSISAAFVEEQYNGYKADVALGLDEPGSWRGAEDWFAAITHTFNATFFIEVLIRFLVGGMAYIKNEWGWFDVALVVMSSIDAYILSFIEGGSGQNFIIIRIIRCIRLLRTLRLARELRMMKPLYLFMRTLASSIFALVWSIVFLVIVQLMGAIFICKSLHKFIVDPAQNIEDRLWVNRLFGSGSKSVYTFFEITFSGGWPNTVRPLMEKVDPWYAVFFVFYVVGWAFAITKIIGAIFIKETFTQAARDEASHTDEKAAEKRRIVNQFRQLFVKADRSADGWVSSDEFVKLIEDKAVRRWFAAHELEVHDAEATWRLLENGKQEISVTDFVDGLLRMRGAARAQDMMVLLQDSRALTALCERMDARLEALESMATRPQLGRPVSNL